MPLLLTILPLCLMVPLAVGLYPLGIAVLVCYTFDVCEFAEPTANELAGKRTHLRLGARPKGHSWPEMSVVEPAVALM